MQANNEIRLRDIIAAYPTIEHFRDHYTNQCYLNRIFRNQR